MPEAVGIDVGGTKIAGGVVDEHGHIHHGASKAASEIHDADALVAQIAELVAGCEVPAGTPVGVGIAGLVDAERGRYLFGPNTGLNEMDLVAMLEPAIGSRVRIDNDANCAAWAEHRLGAGRGTRHFLCVTLGTGIGGGIVIDGRPYRGAHGGAGEIGHMLVERDGVLCGCGNRGCWEQYASGLALERMARERLGDHPGSALQTETAGDPSRIAGPMITAAARDGDAFALDLVGDLARWVGCGLASLVNVLEPECIAISGGLASEWDLMSKIAIDTMCERMEAPKHRPAPDVVVAALGPDAGLVGAALLVLLEDL